MIRMSSGPSSVSAKVRTPGRSVAPVRLPHHACAVALIWSARLTTRLRVGGADRFGDSAVVVLERYVGDVADGGARRNEIVRLACDHGVTDQALDDLLAGHRLRPQGEGEDDADEPGGGDDRGDLLAGERDTDLSRALKVTFAPGLAHP